MTWRKKLARGFTLIEMSIVMVVIGLVISGGLVAVAPVIQNSKISETNQKLDRIEQALILHTIRYGCLPCPATANVDSTAAGTPGQAIAATSGAYINGCTANACANLGAAAATRGIVPWVNLGLSEADIVDGFGARIDYVLSATLQNSNGMVRTPPATYPPGALRVDNVAGTSEQTGGSATTRAAYVLISHGINRVYGFLGQSGAGPITDPNTSTPEAANSGAGPFRQGNMAPIPGASYFDDLVRYRTPSMVIQLCGTNACGNPA